MKVMRKVLSNLIIKSNQVVLGLALIGVGFIVLADDRYFGFPPEWVGVMNSDVVGFIGIVTGIGLIVWSAYGRWSPNINGILLVGSVFFWTAISVFEGLHNLHDLRFFQMQAHGVVAFALEFVMLIYTFVLIFRTRTRG